MYSIKQKGMTLIELTVVLLILVALAGLTIPYVSGTSRKALCDATDVSMMNIKQVIMQRYYLDTLGRFPSNSSNANYSLHYLFNAGSRSPFDPDSQVGWRGPYLQGGITLDATDISSLDASFNNNTTYMNKEFVADDNDIAVLDAWGRPFVLQVVDTTTASEVTTCNDWGMVTTDNHCARLVSAGAGSGLGLSEGSIDTTIAGPKGHDDRVLYLNVPTPASDINESCSD